MILTSFGIRISSFLELLDTESYVLLFENPKGMSHHKRRGLANATKLNPSIPFRRQYFTLTIIKTETRRTRKTIVYNIYNTLSR